MSKAPQRRIAALEGKVAELGGAVDLLKAEKKKEIEPGEYCWKGLRAAQQQSLWKDVADWVGWLVGRYQLQERVPPCWVRHPPMVEELTALYAGWQHAYLAGTDASGFAPLDWLTHLSHALTRLREWDELGCATAGVHREPYPVRWHGESPPTVTSSDQPDVRGALRQALADDAHPSE
jgi:hypothetical protein